MSDQDTIHSPFSAYAGDDGFNDAPSGGGDDDTTRRMKQLFSLLRGRWHWVVLAALVLGVAGGIAGHYAQEDTYFSEAKFLIRPTVESPRKTPMSTVPPRFEDWLNAQLDVLRSPEVRERARQTQVWAEATQGLAESPGFGKELSASRAGRTYVFTVASEHESPQLAQAAVEATLAAFREVFEERQAQSQSQIVANLVRFKRTLEGELRQLTVSRDAVADNVSPSQLLLEFQSKNTERARMQQALSDARLQLQILIADSAKGLEELTIADIAARDRRMNQMVLQREALDASIQEDYAIGLLDDHPTIVRKRKSLANLEERISEFALQYREGLIEPNQAGATDVAQRQIRLLETRIAELTKAYDVLQAETSSMGELVARINDLSGKIEATENDIASAQGRIEALMESSDVVDGRIEIITNAALPGGPGNHGKRVQVAVMGGVGGAGLGVALIILLGLLDRHLRHASDAQLSLPDLKMLGILPTLPEKLDDPEQGEMAAHSVHHIRAMLQLRQDSGSRVFSITSASAGSGKSSLTVALGLSFASSGSRVLVFDCDLVGGGLTLRLLGSEPQGKGVLDACAGTALADCVTPSGTRGLDILPLGKARPQDAASLSPKALRRLIAEARREYDVVIVDTGPVLGSLEASMVAPEVDSVVMVLSRGDRKGVVNQSISRIRGVGANVAGIVFNHALDYDIAHMSYGSQSFQSRSTVSAGRAGQPVTNTVAAARFGPLGSAVAAFTEPADNVEHTSGAA